MVYDLLNSAEEGRLEETATLYDLYVFLDLGRKKKRRHTSNRCQNSHQSAVAGGIQRRKMKGRRIGRTAKVGGKNSDRKRAER